MTLPSSFPARFIFQGLAVQSMARELSRSGVLVSCLRPPPPGSEVSLRLFMPDSEMPVTAAAIVRQVLAVTAGDTDFWCEFTSLEPRARERIAALTPPPAQPPSRREQPGLPAGKDLRSSPRRPVHMKVRFSNVRQFLERYATDISAGGLFIHTLRSLPPGEIVEISLELPDGGAPANTRARVAHIIKPDGTAGARKPGLGLQFIGADQAFRQRIDEFMKRLADEPIKD